MPEDCENRSKILCLARAAIANNNTDFVPRRKNRETLAQLGMMPSDIYDKINELTKDDWHGGPKPDDDPRKPDPIWEFKKMVDGKRIYIKFKIVQNENNLLRVIGFHFDGM
ncbi:MAG TPA: hypothetical protein VHO94_04125 [Oscillospiraceae bacterium]|nr:hypothetical protein [Oscillospiraceae bacterium]